MRSMVAKALAMPTIHRSGELSSSFPKNYFMFNLKNLFCFSVATLLIGVSPISAESSQYISEVNVSALKGGVVDIIQLRTSVRVEMSGQGYVYLSLSDARGRNTYRTTVNALKRNHFISTKDLPAGQYRLTAYTQEGNFEFYFTIN